MKKTAKALLLALCAVLLVVGSVLGTLAYLTDTEKVVNTFTVGKVDIYLDEAKVDENGQELTGENAKRVMANVYHLLPGHNYRKDPTVHVRAGSDAMYLFVKVENQIEDLESNEVNYQSISEQIAENRWTQLPEVPGVYYRELEKHTSDQDYVVFESFAIDQTVTNEQLDDYAGKTVTVTAYAVQQDGVTDVAAAWSLVKDLETKYEPTVPTTTEPETSDPGEESQP